MGKIHVRELYPPGIAPEIKSKIKDPRRWGRAGILENYETMARHKDGTLIPVWLSADHSRRWPGSWSSRTFSRPAGTKAPGEELLQSERLSALGRAAAHINHEIKNPLMLIGGFARQVLKNISADLEKDKEKLQIIVDEVQRLESFLVEVGSYAKISEPQKRLGDLNALVKETCQRLEPSHPGKRHYFTAGTGP